MENQVTTICAVCGRERRVGISTAKATDRCRSCAKKKDITGMVFGRLTAIRPVRTTSDGKHQYWLCRCSCSKEIEIRRNNFINGRTSSCGCLAKEVATAKLLQYKATLKTPEDHPQFKGGPVANLFRQQQRASYKRGFEWRLTFSQFESLLRSDCFYCGAKPSRDCKGLIRNGIDRIHADLGYAPDNCVPCCWSCNNAKGTMSGSAFIELCGRVYLNCSNADWDEELDTSFDEVENAS